MRGLKTLFQFFGTPFGEWHRGRSIRSWIHEAKRRLDKSDGLGWRKQGLMFLIAAIAIISRRPDVLSNPQFYAEGGTWYAQAYNLGWLHTVALPEGGYLQGFPRLVAGLCLLIPLQFAPLLMNIFGIGIQALPITLLLSARCSGWGSLTVRLCLAGVYLALPNSAEIDVVLTNAQWHLALAACLLAFARPPPPGNWPWKVFDVTLMALSGLTGPFSIILAPLVGIFWWARRQPWSGIMFGTLATAASLQCVALLRTGLQWRMQRLHGQILGATPLLFAKILSGNIYVGALFGRNRFAQHVDIPAISIVALLGTSVLI